MAFIRQYEPLDFDATAHICRETLPPSLRASPETVRLAPYLWTHQYTHLSPSTCLVLDDGAGHAVGYCVGCPDIDAFCAAYPRYVSGVLAGEFGPRSPVVPEPAEPRAGPDGEVNAVAQLAQMAYDARRLVVEGQEAMIADGYRATMHIDLLEGWQGKGWGRRLLNGVVARLEGAAADGEKKSKGVWLGVGDENDKVVPFYEKMGFRTWEPKQPGVVHMVREYGRGGVEGGV